MEVIGLFGNRNAENTLIGEDEFIKRDIFNTNQNVSNTACQTQRDVLDSKYNIGTEVLENRYANQLATQSIISSQKDCCCETNQNIIENRYNNALGQSAIQKDLMQNRYDNATRSSCNN